MILTVFLGIMFIFFSCTGNKQNEDNISHNGGGEPQMSWSASCDAFDKAFDVDNVKFNYKMRLPNFNVNTLDMVINYAEIIVMSYELDLDGSIYKDINSVSIGKIKAVKMDRSADQYSVTFNYELEVAIPKESFVLDSGAISVGFAKQVKTITINETEMVVVDGNSVISYVPKEYSERNGLPSIYLYYKIENEKVYFADKPFNNSNK